MNGEAQNQNDEQMEENGQEQNENSEPGVNDEGQNNNGPESGNAGGKSERTFTQEEVNRMMANEKRQGKNSVYKELGVDPNDKKAMAMIKALLDSQKDDESESEGNSAELDEANKRAAVAEAKAEAMMQGILPKYVDDAIALALPKVTEDKDLKAVLKDLKAKYPVWVKEDSDNGMNKGKSGTGSSLGSSSKGGNGNNDVKGIGARLAASRKAAKPKSSYWNKNNK